MNAGTATLPLSGTSRRSTWKSVGAVAAGFATVVVGSLGTDQVLHVLDVYPPWGQAMHEPSLNLLALSYRVAFTVLASYLTARLAPHSPMRHAWILGFVGLFLGSVGVITTLPMKFGPAWYPIAIALTALPCAWLGGWYAAKQLEERDAAP